MSDSQNKTKTRKSSLAMALVLMIGCSILLINIVQMLIVTSSSKKAIIDGYTKDYTEIAEAYSLAMENDLWGYQQELNYYLLSDVMQNGTFEEMTEWLRAHESERTEDFDYIMLAGPDGISYNDIGSTTNIATRSYFNAIMKEGKDEYIDDPVISKTTGKAVCHITRAVKQNGRTVAMLAGVVNLTDLTAELDALKIGEKGYAWMLASDGTVIAHPVKEYTANLDKNFITGLSAGFEDMADVAKNIAAGVSGYGWVSGLGGGKDLIVHTGIKGTPWGLALSIPEIQITSVVNTVRNQLIIGGILSILILVILGTIVLVASLKPLTLVQETINGIASGDADLTKRIELNSRNEIGQVVSGFNNFASKLQTIISQVKDSKQNLTVAGEDMSAAAEDTASSITQIIANIESMRRQIEGQGQSVAQTAGAVNEIASNIESLEHMIEGQSSGVTQASAAVEQMIGNIASVNQSVEKMASSFSTLRTNAQAGFTKQQAVNERVQQIETQSQMLQEANAAISAIAEQTNLLAMNAAIEAAHAGEAGKGFSVVADEIRKLSETSTAQSKTIGDQLNSIKDSINEVVTASNEASTAFESVSKKLVETDELVLQIKSAMEEQNEGSKQITEALHNMNDSTVEVRNASNEMEEGNKMILSEVKHLQDATTSMTENMQEMSVGARKINETGAALSSISIKMKESINQIGEQIDQFKV